MPKARDITFQLEMRAFARVVRDKVEEAVRCDIGLELPLTSIFLLEYSLIPEVI